MAFIIIPSFFSEELSLDKSFLFYLGTIFTLKDQTNTRTWMTIFWFVFFTIYEDFEMLIKLFKWNKVIIAFPMRERALCIAR